MDILKRIVFGSAFVLTFSLFSCSPPPFDLGISASAQTAKKLALVGQVQIDPNSVNLGSPASQGNADVVFIPEKDGAGGITIQAGFVYSMDPTSGQQVSFIAYDGNQGKYVRYGSTLPIGPLSTDPFPATMLQSVKNLHTGIAFQFVDSAPVNNQYTIAAGDPSTNSFGSPPVVQGTLSSLVQVAPFSGVTKEVIGVSIYTDSTSTTSDRTYWLFRRQGFNTYREARFDYNQTSIPAGAYVRGAVAYDLSGFVGDQATTGRVLYYYDPPPTDRSYVSVWNSPLSPGNWSTWVWIDNASPPTHWQLSGIGNRIDDLLTTGELFSTEGNVGRVFDPKTPTGTLEATFPLSDLRFIGEMYIGGTATMLFSHALWAGRQLSFNIYSIPTADIKTLGQ